MPLFARHRWLTTCAVLVVLSCAIGAYAAEYAPVRAPHDLIIGRITYVQDGKRVDRLHVGTPVAISCNYNVFRQPSPFTFTIQPWRGIIQIGGQAPQVLEFQGNPEAGLHEARVIWTPSASGKVPVSCSLNPAFDSAEANAGNNRWNELVEVLPGGPPLLNGLDAIPPAVLDTTPAQAGKVALPVLDEAWRNEQAAKGKVLVDQDPMAQELRSQWQNKERLRAFDIGMAVAKGDSAPGPGKQAIHAALHENEQRPFEIAVWYSIDRHANAEAAAKGAYIATLDPTIAKARMAKKDIFYRLGFDIGTGIFGNPSLGALGNTAMGPGSLKIRNALAPAMAQQGFDDSAAFNLRRFGH